MYETNSFSAKIKNIYFNHEDRFSRKTFVVTFVGLLVFLFISSPLLYKLCSLFLPFVLIVLFALAYVVCVIYAMIVLCIKRLHDLNLSGWLSILVMIPYLNILFLAYLCIKEGVPESNDYGDALEYEGPAFLLFLCYGVLCVYAAMMGVGLYFGAKLRNIQNTSQGVQKLVNLVPKTLKEELISNPKAMGALFINNQFTVPVVSITKNRVLVRGNHFKPVIQAALSQNKTVEIRFSDDSTAKITRFITSDDSVSVQMSVFEIDKPFLIPAKLSDRNRKFLENINAF